MRRATETGITPYIENIKFLSTLSLRRATLGAWKSCNVCRNFYPRSPCGERLIFSLPLVLIFLFLSTLSLRRATSVSKWTATWNLSFLSTLSLRRATQVRACQNEKSCISIHALLAESDPHRGLHPYHAKEISIHALLAESDTEGLFFLVPKRIFLSTLSLRRATV